jgi:CRP-like cAMP-binding protein
MPPLLLNSGGVGIILETNTKCVRGNLLKMVIQAEFIKSIAYFTGLGETELGSIRKYIFEKRVDRGEIILFEGEPAEMLYFVATGVVKVFKTSADGKEQILQIIRPGESFNDVPVFGGVNLVNAGAMGPVVLNVMKKTDLAAILGEHPGVALNAIRVLSQRVEQMIALVEDLSFRHVTGRVARILLEYAGDRTGDRTGDRPRLTQQEMAAMIGTAREMVGRSLKNMEEAGAIRLERHRVIITDEKALRNMAGVTS